MNPGEFVHTIMFYLLGLVAVLSAVAVVIGKRVLRAAVALTVTLVSTAGFYILLDYDFIAGIQVLVFVGGIIVLIVYAIMLTSSLEIVEERPAPWRKLLAGMASLLFFVVTAGALSDTHFAGSLNSPPPTDLVANIGRKLLDTGPTGFVLPFEIISMLLLAVVIGGIVVARGHTDETEAKESAQ